MSFFGTGCVAKLTVAHSTNSTRCDTTRKKQILTFSSNATQRRSVLPTHGRIPIHQAPTIFPTALHFTITMLTPPSFVALLILLLLVAICSVSCSAEYLNIDGDALQPCSSDGIALTGYTRSGYCIDRFDNAKNVQTSLIDVPPSSLPGTAILTMKKLRKESTFYDALFNKRHGGTFSERNITQKRNRRLATNGCSNGLLLAPIKLHLVALTLLAVCVSIVHLDPVAQALESLLYVLDLTKNGTIFASKNFRPLSILNWVTHVSLFIFSIEFAYSFYLLNKIHPNKTAKKKYARFCTVFSVAILQAIFTILGHSQIAHNTKLSWGFLCWDRMLIMNNIFFTGLAVTFGSWILIPCFWAMVKSYVGFHNWAGRILATITQIIYFGPEIPRLFSCSFLLIPLLALIDPFGAPTDTDMAHLFSALILNTLFGLMLFGLRRKIFDVMNHKAIPIAGGPSTATSTGIPCRVMPKSAV